jgi:hypothetical protein
MVKSPATEASDHKGISPKDQQAAKSGRNVDSFSGANGAHHRHAKHAHRHESHDTSHFHHAAESEPAGQWKGQQDWQEKAGGGWEQPVEVAPQPAPKDNFGHSPEHLDQKAGGGRAGGVIGNRGGDYGGGGGWGW